MVPDIVTPSFSATIAALFPPGVVATEFAGTPHAAMLDAAEAACAARFGAKRRADFAGGRACARVALEALGHGGHSLLVAHDRRPVWPAGIVGNISHADGFCAAVVGRSASFRSLGLDVEVVGRVDEDLWPGLFTERERADLASSSSSLGAEQRATILFSVKEAFYKCRFGLDAGWLDFTDVDVVLEPTARGAGAFTAEIVAPGHTVCRRAAGRYRLHGDFALAGLAVSKDFSPANR